METSDSNHECDVQKRIRTACGRAAILHGLQAADAEACEIDFELHMAQPRQHAAWVQTNFSQAWLNSCAAHFVSNFCRGICSIRGHEHGDNDAIARAAAIASQDVDPELRSQQVEIRNELEAAIAVLSQPHAMMLRMRYTEQRSYAEIARAFGSTPDAVRMAIKRALAVVESRLLLAGFDPDEAMGILAPAESDSLTN